MPGVSDRMDVVGVTGFASPLELLVVVMVLVASAGRDLWLPVVVAAFHRADLRGPFLGGCEWGREEPEAIML